MAVGHPSFLLGELSNDGWIAYFPVAFLLKSSLAELALLVPIAVVAGREILRGRGHGPFRLEGPTLWGLVAAVYFASLLTSPVNLGHRYLFVVYPLGVLLGVTCLYRLVPGRIAHAVAAGLVALQAMAAATAHPNPPQYFNPLVGGPAQGHRYLVDSNLDWGQDLPALEARLDALGAESGGTPAVLLLYFGQDCPRDYEIPQVPWPVGRRAPEWVALSATHLRGVYVDDAFRGFRELEPAHRAGSSIFLYDYRDPAVRAAARDALGPGAASR